MLQMEHHQARRRNSDGNVQCLAIFYSSWPHDYMTNAETALDERGARRRPGQAITQIQTPARQYSTVRMDGMEQ